MVVVVVGCCCGCVVAVILSPLEQFYSKMLSIFNRGRDFLAPDVYVSAHHSVIHTHRSAAVKSVFHFDREF